MSKQRHGDGSERGPVRRRRRWLRRSLLLLLVVVLVSPLVLLWLLVDDYPVVQEVSELKAVDTHRARALAKRAYLRLVGTDGPGELVFTEQELNGLAALGARALPGLRSRVNITPWGLETALSIPLARGRYMNVRAGVEPSSRGIRFSHVSIGKAGISGRLALPVMRTVGNLVLGEQRASLLIDTVQGVNLDNGSAVVLLHPTEKLRAALTTARSRLADKVGLLADPETIGFYHDRLRALDAAPDKVGGNSLAGYMSPLFTLAQERSRDGDPVAENEALIYAVATYFGSYHFASLTGLERAADAGDGPSRKGNPTLAGRRDLRLHFLISAGLELASNHDVSIAIGEFKELLDTEQGGSGFSFTDLAADRAGVRFAQVATSDAASARRLQEIIAESRMESAFFPPLDGLVDGLTQQQFEQVYGGVAGEPYRAVVADIDARIADLPVHRR